MNWNLGPYREIMDAELYAVYRALEHLKQQRLDVSDSVNRGTSTARRMQASLYDWIVYQRRYKARERKGEKEDGWCGRLVQISCEGRQGASGKRDNSRKQYHTV